MKIIRYLNEQDEASYGWVNQNKIGAILDSPFSHYRRLEAFLPVERTTLLPPLIPGKIVSIQRNFNFQNEEQSSLPDIPFFYLKPADQIVGHQGIIRIPKQCKDLVAQTELAVVIGKEARWAPLKSANEYIFGYTCAITCYAKDLLETDDYQQNRAFFFDTFTSLGPWIETELDPNDIIVSTSLNRSLLQIASTHEMLFSIPSLVAYLSSIMTLMPGDVILTGPTNPGTAVKTNDFLQVEIAGVGTLENTIMPE